jgi:2-oxo-3-hexenedioate decarboxylase
MPSADPNTSRSAAAATLREARTLRKAVSPFTDTDDSLQEAWGYDVQALDLEQRLSAGGRLVGVKLGLTSEPKQRRMGIDRPIVGFLTESMLLSPEVVAGRLPQWIQPRIEPEIAFTTSRPIDQSLDLAGVIDVVAGVAVAAEIIDSRYVDYRFRLPDVVADNTSAAGVLLGPMLALDDPDALPAAACTVRVDAELVHQATGAAILGHPLEAMVWLSHHLAERGEVLPAGSVVLAGALTDAVPLLAGSGYLLEIEGLGAIKVQA